MTPFIEPRDEPCDRCGSARTLGTVCSASPRCGRPVSPTERALADLRRSMATAQPADLPGLARESARLADEYWGEVENDLAERCAQPDCGQPADYLLYWDVPGRTRSETHRYACTAHVGALLEEGYTNHVDWLDPS